MWDIIITRHKIKTYFNLLQEIYWVLVLYILNPQTNQFHRSIEERTEPYNSKLLLIPTTITGSPYYQTF